MQQDNSVAMTALVLRCWQQTRLGEVPQTEHTTGAHLHTRNPLEFLESPTGSTTSSVSTTAACGLTTATTTSNTGPPVTAGVTSHPAQVSDSGYYGVCVFTWLLFNVKSYFLVCNDSCGIWRSPLHNIWWCQLLLQWQRGIYLGDLGKETADNPGQNRASEQWVTEDAVLLKVSVFLNSDQWILPLNNDKTYLYI